MSEEKKTLNFLEQIIEEDLANGMPKQNLRFRFPPEPNGYLHIGHTKAIGISFGLGLKYNAPVNLRFDDTNPAKEEQEYVDAIKRDIAWLGFKWANECYSSDYFQQLRDLCDELDWLLMFDEVQTGNGRTGMFFYHQYSGVQPDVVTTAKGLGNGMPIGACLAHGEAAKLMQPGNHGSTFGGNPLASAVALKVVELIESGDIYQRAVIVGNIIMQGLTDALEGVEHVIDIRGCGCMIGIELTKPCKSLYTEALKHGLVINVTADSVIRLLPPMIMTDQEAQQVVSILAPLIKDFQ